MATVAPDMYTVKIEALDGPAIRTTVHQGQTYVGGTIGQRYQIKIIGSGRFLAVVAVDGLNVLDATPGSIHGQGMVITGSGAFDGWRTSMDEVAAFRITSSSESYAAGKGDTGNVGAIGVAIFEEKHVMRALGVTRGPRATPAVARSAGTSFGERHTSSVSTTSFERRAAPTTVLTIRYNTIDALIEAGILEPPGPSAFPADSPVFCEAPTSQC